MRRFAITVIALTFLGGCGSTGYQATDSGPSFDERQLQAIDDAKKNGDYDKAYEKASNLVDGPSIDENGKAALSKLRSFPNHKNELRDYLGSWMDAINNAKGGAARSRGPQMAQGFTTGLDGYNKFLKTTEKFEKAGYSPAIHREFNNRANQTLSERVASGEFSISDNASYSHIPDKITDKLEADRNKKLLEELKDQTHALGNNIAPYIKLAEEKGRDSESHRALRKRLPGLTVGWNTLDDLEELYPEYVSQVRRDLKTTVRFEPEGEKGELVAFDLVENMKSDFDSAEISDLAENPDYTVTVKAIRWTSRQLPERQRTVRYARHQVQLLAGTLMMPDNSSYVYNVNEGGAEMRYAVRVTVRNAEGEVVSREMFRDTEKETYQYCSEARIVNAFGGSEPASFVANEHMQRTCQDSSPNVDVTDLEKDALSNIESGIKDLDPFSNLGEDITLPDMSA